MEPHRGSSGSGSGGGANRVVAGERSESSIGNGADPPRGARGSGGGSSTAAVPVAAALEQHPQQHPQQHAAAAWPRSLLERADALVAAIAPTAASNARRAAIERYVRRLAARALAPHQVGLI